MPTAASTTVPPCNKKFLPIVEHGPASAATAAFANVPECFTGVVAVVEAAVVDSMINVSRGGSPKYRPKKSERPTMPPTTTPMPKCPALYFA